MGLGERRVEPDRLGVRRHRALGVADAKPQNAERHMGLGHIGIKGERLSDRRQGRRKLAPLGADGADPGVGPGVRGIESGRAAQGGEGGVPVPGAPGPIAEGEQDFGIARGERRRPAEDPDRLGMRARLPEGGAEVEENVGVAGRERGGAAEDRGGGLGLPGPAKRAAERVEDSGNDVGPAGGFGLGERRLQGRDGVAGTAKAEPDDALQMQNIRVVGKGLAERPEAPLGQRQFALAMEGDGFGESAFGGGGGHWPIVAIHGGDFLLFPLTLPALRAGPLPLPQGERGIFTLSPPWERVAASAAG